MRICIAMDSFKGNFSSLAVAGLVENGIRRVYPDAQVEKVAVADGGEGTVDALVEYFKGKIVYKEVHGPRQDVVKARYGIVNGTTAVMETAETSGLYLIPEEKRDPFLTSTYGLGELIADALEKGCRKIILGIGGSATNDGGAGMAAALGARLTDAQGRPVGPGCGGLARLAHIGVEGFDKRVAQTEFLVACDVDNPLCGENGASYVFGPQKGAKPESLPELDANLARYADVIGRDLARQVKDIPGAGAAGGLGAGLMAFCNARLAKGVEIVLEALNLDEKVRNADVVITGEGRIDGQTAHGKVPVGVAAAAKKYGKPVFAIAGYADKGASEVYRHGIDGIVSSVVAPMTQEQALAGSAAMIEDAGERVFRIVKSLWR